MTKKGNMLIQFKCIKWKRLLRWLSDIAFFVSPAKHKQDICIAFPAVALSAAAA